MNYLIFLSVASLPLFGAPKPLLHLTSALGIWVLGLDPRPCPPPNGFRHIRHDDVSN